MGKDNMLGKTEDSRKRGTRNVRWVGSVRNATGLSLQELSGGTEHRTLRTSVVYEVTRSKGHSTVCNTHRAVSQEIWGLIIQRADIFLKCYS